MKTVFARPRPDLGEVHVVAVDEDQEITASLPPFRAVELARQLLNTAYEVEGAVRQANSRPTHQEQLADVKAAVGRAPGRSEMAV